MIDIKGYESDYAIDENKGVFSKKRNKYLKHSINGGGYPQVILCKDSITKAFQIHVLVANHYLSNPENKPEVNHKNGNRLYFHSSNLEFVTKSENMQHRILTLGKDKKGERSPVAKLRMAEIPVIIELRKRGHTLNKIANRFGVTSGCIYGVVTGRSWQHIFKNKMNLHGNEKISMSLSDIQKNGNG